MKEWGEKVEECCVCGQKKLCELHPWPLANDYGWRYFYEEGGLAYANKEMKEEWFCEECYGDECMGV